MTIRDWPKGERPREKLLAKGAASLSEAELLAIFLRTGVRGKSAVDLARELLTKFKSLTGLFAASEREFCTVPGMGRAKFVQFQAALELTKRSLHESLAAGDALSSPRAVRDFLRLRLREYPFEIFLCVFVDTQNRVIAVEELFRGTLNQTSVYPREVARHALAHNAAAVILAHNHPSGVAEPSSADVALTRALKEALSLVEVRVLDHFVVTAGEALSFAERGLL